MNINIATACDFYKVSHKPQYPLGASLIYSNFTPRSASLFKQAGFDNKILWVGMQRFLIQYLIEEWNEFFTTERSIAVKKYKRRLVSALGPDYVTTDHIAQLHDLGFLPVEIKSIPEGSIVDIGVPVFTIHNTLPSFFWVVNYLETLLSTELWKCTTVATIALQYKKLFDVYALKTTGSTAGTEIQGHDFSFRGMSGVHDAANSSIGHIVPFVGSDTIPAIDTVEYYYGDDAENTLIACSVNATEHSTACSNILLIEQQLKETGQYGNYSDSELRHLAETKFVERLITEIYPTGIVSSVSDSFDYWYTIDPNGGILATLKDKVLARQPDSLGLCKTVVRPDSGDPVEVVCGIEIVTLKGEPYDFDSWKEMVAEYLDDKLREETPHGEHGGDITDYFDFYGVVYKVTYSPDWNRHDKQYYYIDNFGSEVDACEFEQIELTVQQKGSIQCLWEIFGGTVTEQGYKVLNPKVGLIYGDSITLDRARAILERLERKGFASTNVVFGIGSYTYQMITRDTFGFAMKATAGTFDGRTIAIKKDPITDSGTKKSASGFLVVRETDTGYVLEQNVPFSAIDDGVMKTVFKNSNVFNLVSFTEIRNRYKEQLAKFG